MLCVAFDLVFAFLSERHVPQRISVSLGDVEGLHGICSSLTFLAMSRRGQHCKTLSPDSLHVVRHARVSHFNNCTRTKFQVRLHCLSGFGQRSKQFLPNTHCRLRSENSVADELSSFPPMTLNKGNTCDMMFAFSHALRETVLDLKHQSVRASTRIRFLSTATQQAGIDSPSVELT